MTAARRWPAAAFAALLWLALVGLVFRHDRNKHPLAEADKPLVERTVRLLAPRLMSDPERTRFHTYPVVSHSRQGSCVALEPYRLSHPGGRICYAPDGRVVEERVFAKCDFCSPSIGERIADALDGDC